jgi:pimeloyl-ACP methyl ester carboxylesterase
MTEDAMTEDATSAERRPRSDVPKVDDARWQHRFAQVNGVQLHYVEAGAGPLVLLLHGFPELWYAWRHQMPALAAAGFHVVAPDLRGYNLSDKPHGVTEYAVEKLADDVHGLMLSLGAHRANVVGHDFGAGIAWAFAMRHPGALARLAILNGPHPVSMLRGLLDPRQLFRSWYMFFFQLPCLPERLARRNDFALLFAPFELLPEPARFTPEEREVYRQAFARPGALTAMINYYRAMFRPNGIPKLARVDAEVLVLWGEADPYLRPAVARPSPRWVPRAQVEVLPNVGHFIQHEAPAWVSERLIGFLSAPPGPSPAREAAPGRGKSHLNT